jgi:hypothetical protein
MIYFVSNASEIFEDDSIYKCSTVEESLKLLETIKIVGLDTETEGFDPYTKKLLSLQLGCKDFQVVIDTSTVDVSLYKEYLESDRTFLGWNLKFDLRFLYRHNIYPKKVYDGYLAEKLLWLGYPSGIHGCRSADLQHNQGRRILEARHLEGNCHAVPGVRRDGDRDHVLLPSRMH